jgi:hypothetical protein
VTAHCADPLSVKLKAATPDLLRRAALLIIDLILPRHVPSTTSIKKHLQ